NALIKLPEQSAPEAVWGIQNVPLHTFGSAYRLFTPFNAGLLGVEDGQDVGALDFSLSITNEMGEKVNLPTTFTTYDVNKVNYHVGVQNPPDNPITRPLSPFSEKIWNLGAGIESLFRGNNVPNIDLNAREYPEDLNACGPASCANSMMWLEENDDRIPYTDLELDEMYEDLLDCMEKNNGQGVTTTDVIRGKLCYIDYYRLPIHVKYQSMYVDEPTLASPDPLYGHKAENKMGTSGKPDFEWIKQELENGEDVELLFGWYDENGNREGGHWVTLTGAVERGGVKGLYFNDDIDQANEGGTREFFVEWEENEAGWAKLAGLEYQDLSCWVESAVSESYDPSVNYGTRGFDIFRFRNEGPGGLGFWNKALIRFTTLPDEQNRFLNVFGTNPFTLDTEWLVRNQFIPPSGLERDVSALFNLKQLGYDASTPPENLKLGISLNYQYFASAEEGIEPRYFQSYNLLTEDDLLAEQTYFREKFKLPVSRFGAEIICGIEPLEFLPGQPVTWIDRTDEMPNIDLDNSKYNPGTLEGYAGDYNACAPAAAANSMQWLENRHDENIQSNL
ncbi:MAG TPA: hypothetical protein PLK12_18030, partial [Prolixibacteraceae bacterium]|nr:hypothetical protein [Prolixibacteraceae bacterium]